MTQWKVESKNKELDDDIITADGIQPTNDGDGIAFVTLVAGGGSVITAVLYGVRKVTPIG